MAVIQNVAFYKGEDVSLHFTMSPVEDITGWTIVLTLKQTPSTAVLDVISATITDGPAGEFTIDMPASVTGIEARSYVYDVVRTDPGAVKVLAMGTINIKAGVRTP